MNFNKVRYLEYMLINGESPFYKIHV